MKLYAVVQRGGYRAFETTNKQEAENWLKENIPAKFHDSYYICEQGKDDCQEAHQ